MVKCSLTGPFETYHDNGRIHLKGKYSNSGKNSIAYEYYPTGEHLAYIVSQDDSLFYKKTFYKSGEVKDVKFPLLFEENESQICVSLQHSILEEEQLKSVVFLGEGDYFETVTKTNERVFSTQGFNVCFQTDRETIKGYFCEFLLEDNSIQGCMQFEYRTLFPGQ